MTKTSLRIAALAAMIHVLAHTAPAQTPLGTEFTYQGRLADAGGPANGLHDLRFRLYDALAGGAQVGATVCFDNVSVTDGLFTVLLDFGAQFAGDERFLEIDVRADSGRDCTNAAGFIILTPRQALTTAPHAAYAMNADQLDGLDATAFLQSIPIPLTLIGTSNNWMIKAENATTAAGAASIHGAATGATGNTYAGYFQSASTSGTGVLGISNALSGTTYGVRGVSDSTAGRAVFGQATAASGATYGGYFEANSNNGTGVYGSGGSYGVVGEGGNAGVKGNGYNGVIGVSDNFTGHGVFGWTTADSGGYGVYGQATPSAGYAVYANGDMGASGVKPFRIDHPDDPANKYLLHYAAESPEVINFYSGKVTLDGAGEAVVELPHYFAKINMDPRYTLTAVGAPMPMLHVAEEIDEAALSAGARAEPGEAAPPCSFRIAGGAPGAKVSWEVKALRNDLRMRVHGAPVEREKEGLERGMYQHPELYGQPPEMGMNYHADPERPSPAAPPEAAPR